MTVSSLSKKCGLAIAAIAFTFSITSQINAQELAGKVVSVPTPSAAALITTKVDDSKVAPIGPLSHAVTELPAAQGATDLGRADGGMIISMQMGLRRGRDQVKALVALRNATEDPTSPMYGKTLTPQEFAAETGLNPSDLATLQTWLKGEGFTVSAVDNGRLTIDFSGRVSDVEAAFHTEIHNYRAADGSMRYGNSIAIEMPRALVPAVAEVAGLENFTPFYSKNFGGPVSDITTHGMTTLEQNAPPAAVRATGNVAADFSFTASKASVQVSGQASHPVVLNVRISDPNYSPTGSLVIKGDKGVLGSISDISSCDAVSGGNGRSCSFELGLPVVGLNHLKAIYSGNEDLRGIEQTLVIPLVGSGASYTAETSLPTNVSATSTSNTYTIVTTWVGLAQATGSMTIYYYIDYPDFFTGAATYPATGVFTSSGSGTDTFGERYTYSCTTVLASTTITCTVVQAHAYTEIGGYGPYGMEATYSGDTNYGSSEQDSALVNAVRRAGSFTPTISFSNTLSNQTYGTGVAESATTTVTTTGGGNPGGLSTSYPGLMVIYDANQLGTPIVYSYEGSGVCTGSTSWTCGPYALSWTNQPILNPGTYTVTFLFTGNIAGASGTLTLGPGSNSLTFTVNKQAPTATTTAPVSTSPETQTVGALSAFTVSGTLAWTGSGNAPTQSDISFTSTAGGVFGATTCTNTGTGNLPATPYTCSATFTPTATDGAGSYNINLKFAGDTNYSAVTDTQVGNYVISKATTTAVMTSPVSTSPVTQQQGSLSAFAVSGTLSWTGNGPVPTASDISFTSTAAGSFAAVNCTGATSPYTCTSTFTPTGTDTAGSYNINISFSGDSNYSSATSSQVGNYIITSNPDIVFSSVTHNMGSVLIGNSTTYGVHVTNTTAAAIPFTAVVISTSASPNPFTQQNNCGTSIPVAGCEIVFTYAPVAGDSGTQTATWSMTGTAGGTTFGPSNGGTLTGTVAPSGNVTITTAGHNFGDVTVGTTSPTYGTVITNSTNAAVTLTLGSVTSPFASVTNCPTTLGAGVSCNLNFTFHPTATGLVQQMYSISVNGGAIPLLVNGSPTTGVTLTGTGD